MHKKPVADEVLVPVRIEQLSAEKFAEVVERSRVNIARSRFIPPKIGRPGFGKFEVEYKVPLLKRAG